MRARLPLASPPTTMHHCTPHRTRAQQLLGKGTRDAMMAWLAGVMEGNAERAKMQVRVYVCVRPHTHTCWGRRRLQGCVCPRGLITPPPPYAQMDITKAASHGFFLNHNAVMLRLAGPFMDPGAPNFWARCVAASIGTII